MPQQTFSLQSYKDQHIVIDHKITNSSGCETHLSTFEQNKIQCNTPENILCRLPHLMFFFIQLLSTQQLQEQNDVF